MENQYEYVQIYSIWKSNGDISKPHICVDLFQTSQRPTSTYTSRVGFSVIKKVLLYQFSCLVCQSEIVMIGMIAYVIVYL